MERASGDWVRFRDLPGTKIEVDFHFSEYRPRFYGPPESCFSQHMEKAAALALDSLKKAYERGINFVIFTHGRSTSRMGRLSSRSEVRRVMRSKESTLYLDRRRSFQHHSVFVAVIRENPEATLPETKCPDCGNRDLRQRSWAGHFRCGNRNCQREFNWFDLAPCPKDSNSSS